VSKRYLLSGRSMTLVELSKLVGLSTTAITNRFKAGWTVERIVSQPRIVSRPHEIIFRGEAILMKRLCELANLTHPSVLAKLNAGWTPEQIVETRVRVRDVGSVIFDEAGCAVTHKQLALEVGVGKGVIGKRLKAGWTVKQIRGAPYNCPLDYTWTLEGIPITVVELAKRLEGVTVQSVSERLKLGVTPEEIVELGVVPSRRGKRYPYRGGDLVTVAEIAKMADISRAIVGNRLKSGMTADEIVELGPIRGRCYLNGELITKKALAALMGVSVTTIQSWVREGIAPEAMVELSSSVRKPPGRVLSCGCIRKNVQHYDVFGQDLTMVELEELSGVRAMTIKQRQRRLNISPTEAAFLSKRLPSGPKKGVSKHNRRMLNGKRITVRALAAEAGVSIPTLYQRLREGLTPEEIVALGGLRQRGSSHLSKGDLKPL